MDPTAKKLITMDKGATMFKTMLIVAFTFCLTSSIADAQDKRSKPMLCYPTMEIVPALKDSGEDIVWAGVSLDNKSFFIVMMNEKSKEFTLIQFDEKIACVLGAGTDAKFVFKTI